MNAILADMARAVRYAIHRNEPEHHDVQDLEERDFNERLDAAEDDAERQQLCHGWLRLYAPEARRV